VFYLVSCTLPIMRSTVAHLVASVVVSLLFVGISCMPARPEKANFVAELHDIHRREPIQPPVADDNATLYNKTDDNTTVSNAGSSLVNNLTQYVERKLDVIYRGLAVLGCISAIIVIYISFRYFR